MDTGLLQCIFIYFIIYSFIYLLGFLTEKKAQEALTDTSSTWRVDQAISKLTLQPTSLRYIASGENYIYWTQPVCLFANKFFFFLLRILYFTDRNIGSLCLSVSITISYL